jgi:hypothetical protein
MMALWNRIVFGLLDPLLGGLLAWSPTAALLAVGIGTSFVLTLTRKWSTNQALLACAAADTKVLKQLIREAKQRGDRDAVQRHRATIGQIGILKLKAEGKPLLYSLLPIAILATWAFLRFEFIPPKFGETIPVVAHAPVSAAGDVIHIVPEPGISCEAGWVRVFAVPPKGEQAEAIWQVRFDENREIIARFRDQTIDSAHPAGPVTIERSLRPFHPFGLIPDFSQIGLPAWLIGYLVVVIPFVPLLKRVLRVQ